MQLLKPAWVSSEGHAFMSIDVHPDGSRFVTGGQGTDCGRICIWNLKPILDGKVAKDKAVPKLLTQMDHHLGCVNTVRWSNDGRFLASGGDDKLVMLWQKSAFSGGSIFGGGGKVHVEQWRLHQTLRGHDGDVLDLAWGPGDVVLATASVDNNIIIWNMERLPEQVAILRGHTSLVKGVFFDPVGKYLASQSDDKTLRIWKTSDWSLEAVIDEPFQESGATTHVLRPGWSPEGSIIVSAHAMNGGGPTAQIVERSSWKANRDFVGHKKAVSCVKFNSRVFEKTSATDSGKTEMFVVVALGSRDRSFSVWTTGLQRPFFVVNDAFDQGVLDLSWSKDGTLLMACSMDGSVAAAVLSPNEIGKPISDARLFELMRSQYGKNCGTIANLKTSGPNITNGGPVVIENPDMLKREDTKTANGHHDVSLGSASGSKTRLWPNQNPTDKQIEARTSDGKRRITPIFIPPPSVENGVVDSKFGLEFGSTSTKEKSTIAIERRDDMIVRPNVSPSKAHENGEKAHEVVKKEAEKKPDEPKVNVIQVKKKPTSANGQEPPVNVIQVKKKPGPASQSPPKKPAASPPLQPQETVTASSKKRKRIAVLSDSSEDDEADDDSDEDTDKEKQQIKEPASKKSNQLEKRTTEDPSKSAKLKESKVKKPDLMTNKAHLDSSPKRPRGRPPLTRETSFNNDLMKSPKVQQPQAQPQQSAHQPTPQTTIAVSQFKLPAMKMDKCKTYNFTMANQCKVVVSVNSISSSKLHEVKVCSDKYNWSALMTSSIVTVGASQEVIVVVCKNGSLHLFKPGDRGQRLVPPMQLPSSASKLTFQNGQLALVTTCGHLYIWTLDPRPRIKMAKENVQSLFDSSSSVAKILLSPEVILITSSGKSFTFDHGLGTWICLADTSSSIQACSNYATASTNLPAATKNLPLASLEYLTPVHPARTMQNTLTDETKALANITHCRNQRLAAEYLNSPQEFEYWLLAEVKHLASLSDVDGLRACFDWLMGPSHAGAKSKEEKIVGCLKKHDLLKAGLVLIKSNLHLQRLYSEYDDQLNSAAEVCEIDKFLHV